MHDPIMHPHSNVSGKTVDWFCTDNQSWYEKNLNDPNKRELLEKFGWIDQPVNYSFNSHGFRADEFDNLNESVLFLGASIVVGTGVSDGHVWTSLVADELNLANYNLGVSGGSNDTSFRLGNHYIPQLKPAIVVYVNSYTWRVDLITDEKFYTFNDMEYSTPKEYRNFYKAWISHPENGDLNYLKNKYGLMQICNINQVKLIEIDGHEIYKMSKHTLGRDLIHPGVLGHRLIADYVCEQLNW